MCVPFQHRRNHEIINGEGSGIGSGKLGSQHVSVTQRTACFELCKITLLNCRWSCPRSWCRPDLPLVRDNPSDFEIFLLFWVTMSYQIWKGKIGKASLLLLLFLLPFFLLFLPTLPLPPPCLSPFFLSPLLFFPVFFFPLFLSLSLLIFLFSDRFGPKPTVPQPQPPEH